MVNAVTLYSVYNAKLQVNGENFESTLASLFDKIKALAAQDYQQALILSGMVFTLVIWVFSILSFILALMFYVFFLWGWIPRQDGGLSGYCERKVTKRLMKIVSTKVNAAIADQERQRKKAELKAAKKAGTLPPEERKATLPTLMPDNDDKLPGMPVLDRMDTVSTLPAYTSRPGTPGQGGFELNQMRPMPGRTETTSTASSRAPLLGAGAEMGMASPALPSPNYPARSATMSSTNTRFGPPSLSRVQTNSSNFGGSITQTPATYSPERDYPPMPQPVRSPTASSVASYGMPPRSTPAPRPTYDEYNNLSGSPAPLRQMPSQTQFDSYSSGRASPAPSYSSRPQGPAYGQGPSYGQSPSYSQGQAYGQGQDQGGYPGGRPGGYPSRSQTNPAPYRGPPGATQPQRNMTAPIPQQGRQSPAPQQGYQQGYQQDYSSPPPEDYFQRPGTAQSQRNGRGPPQPLLRQPTHQSYASYSSSHSELESQRGTPGPGPRY